MTTQAMLRCDCGADPQVRSIRISVVNLNPPYGSARVRGVGDNAQWIALQRIAKPTDVTTPRPEVEAELLDQTRSCTLACIGWTSWNGTFHPCADIQEMTLRQGDTRFRPAPPPAGRTPRKP